MLLHYSYIVMAVSIPQAIVRMWLTFAIWGLMPRYHARKLILFAVVSSILIDIDYLFVPAIIHVLTSTCIVFLVLYVIFRKFGIRNVLVVFLSYSAVSLLTDLMGFILLQTAYGSFLPAGMARHHPLQYQSVFVPIGLALLLLARYLENKNFAYFQRLYQYFINIKQTRTTEVVLLTLFQAFLLGLLFAIGSEYERDYSGVAFNLVFYALVLLTFGAFFYTVRLLVRIREEAVRQTQDVYVEEIGRMFTIIRGQRHDFLNHMQVISSMLKMNKLEQLKKYMDDLVKESNSVASVVSHSSPALAAFIQAKTELSLSRGISFTCDIPEDLNIEATVKSIDLVKIVGNLVDNAFEESDTLPPDQRRVRLHMGISDGLLTIEIANRGRLLSDAEKQMMLLPGYTTKKTGHSGLGLAIVQERVSHYQGRLQIESTEEDGTTVRVAIPHRQRP
ncbi:sensor histidine kinase [Cohnella terricola]|uniref:GHKL domain-containing protein n=1 Tax=Cohnella terricola TaxID=1289167 RepID=A0A559JDP6_9BACL|nr:ATP-binding protein [Cohnella terricola]TVX97987.1 GHKL domain-containing protein [Cohnella terricola]